MATIERQDTSSEMHAKLTVEQLCQWIQRRYEYTRILRELAADQAGLVSSQSFDGLVSLLAKKQVLVESLQNEIPFSETVQKRWKSLRDQLPAEQRQKADQQLKETEQALAELIQQDQQCIQELTQNRDQTRSQLQAISQGVVAQNSYEEQQQGSYFDFQS